MGCQSFTVPFTVPVLVLLEAVHSLCRHKTSKAGEDGWLPMLHGQHAQELPLQTAEAQALI